MRLKYLVILIVSILFISILIIDLYYTNQLKKTSIFSGEVQEWDQITKGKIDADLAVFGSSRAYIHINPQILGKKLGKKVYNLGLNGSKFNMQYYRFNLYLKHNLKPSIIVWNLDSFSFSHTNKIYQPNQYVPFMLWNFTLYNELKGYEEIESDLVNYILPLYRYRNYSYWEKQIVKAKKEKVGKNGLFRKNGFKSYNRKWSVNWNNLKKRNAKFDESNYILLKELIHKCKQEQIKLIFIMSPEFHEGQKYMLNRNEIVKRYSETLNYYHIPLLDYSNDTMSYEKKYFYNTTHMNSKGAELFSNKLSSDLDKYLQKIL